MLQDVSGFFTVTATTWLLYVLHLAQAEADITNQSRHSFPTAQDTSPGSSTNKRSQCSIQPRRAGLLAHAALVQGQGTSSGPSLQSRLHLLARHGRTHLAMNRASEWRQATKRPLMMSVFLAVD